MHSGITNKTALIIKPGSVPVYGIDVEKALRLHDPDIS
jgi:hypothetical protein